MLQTLTFLCRALPSLVSAFLPLVYLTIFLFSCLLHIQYALFFVFPPQGRTAAKPPLTAPMIVPTFVTLFHPSWLHPLLFSCLRESRFCCRQFDAQHCALFTGVRSTTYDNRMFAQLDPLHSPLVLMACAPFPKILDTMQLTETMLPLRLPYTKDPP